MPKSRVARRSRSRGPGGAVPTAEDLLATLRALGRPQIAAIYKRHGSGDQVFGVLTSEIGKLKKRIKVDHELALTLWSSGNAEARMLALQIADPEKLTSSAAESLVKDPQAHFVACYLSELVARSPIAREKMDAWIRSSQEVVREVGYGVLGCRLKDAPETIGDAEAKRMLATIEEEIHCSPNLARHAMNGALIAIGTYKPSLREEAIQVARRIGKIEVDHGKTNCRTPDAVSSLSKASRRKRCP